MKIRRCKLEPGVPAVAMADIAFNLVLFFLILAKTQDDSHLRWEAAHAPTVQNLDLMNAPTVAVDKDNKVYFKGAQVGISQLAGEITKELGNNPPGKRTVQLKIHKDTQAATFEPIIEAVSQAGGEVVHVLAEEKKN
jgi:biopolymer transport protein ExbD